MSTPKAYRYARFSHSRQADGMSLERQADAAEQWAGQRGMVIDDTLAAFIDSGVSASRGKNLVRGAFARFREAVAAGDVAPGSYLLVESVSRFSRLSPLDSVPVLRELVESGIRVVFFDPSIEVTAENLHSMEVGMVFNIMSYISAEYANTLGRYKLKAWERAREQMREGKAATRTLPYWLECQKLEDGKRGPIELHPTYAPIVERIFSEYLAGRGKGQIAARLNADKIPPPSRAAQWYPSVVARTLANPSVTGVFQPHREVKTRITLKSGIAGALTRKRETIGEPIPGYYPAVISAETFAQAATVRDAKRARPGSMIGSARSSAITHLLANLATCPVCGKSMKRMSKGPRTPPRYVCTRALSGAKGACQRVYVTVAAVERAIVDNVASIAADAPIGDPELQAQLRDLDTAIGAVQDEINELAAIRPLSRALNDQLLGYEAKLATMQSKYTALAQRATASSTNVIRKRVAGLAEVLESYRVGMEQAPAVNAALFECFARVVIDYAAGELVMHWRHGPPPTVVRYDASVELLSLTPV
jgi:DNA invertase Pin-like site-specific DNA recombinase